VRSTNLLNVLVLKLGEELLKTLIVSIDTDGLENALDVRGGRRGVAGEAEEEVGSKVLHFVGLVSVLSLATSLLAIERPVIDDRKRLLKLT
jgi:hypothetical protein